MSEQKPETQIETPAADPAKPQDKSPDQLTAQDLDLATGGLWPQVMTGSTYNKTI